ncbi:MAG TPA: A/G-specific adenine glycosylase [Verrucomicrobiae bacterium]|jgi:A/G-specific adenine glycosylase
MVAALFLWYAENARDLPWRRTHDPYAIWVSEIMLQQTQVITVIPFWEHWMHELPTIKAVANAKPNKIHKLWEGLGYYTRARNLQKAAQTIVREHGGQFPSRFDDVLALPGVGRYTAGAICSIAFNQPMPILDGNVIRVLTRTFGIAKDPREKETNQLLWQIAEELVHRAHDTKAKNACSHLNQSLMELGALICTPRNPQCTICPAKKLCLAFREDRIAELPNTGKRAAATARQFIAFVIDRDGKFLVRQRPAGVVNAHLWEFPNLETNGEKKSPAACFKLHFEFAPTSLESLCSFKHSITRYRITLEAFRVKLSKDLKIPAGTWQTKRQLERLAFTSAHKKILAHL